MQVDAMPDPFPRAAHIGDENVIYLQTELLDTNRQFRYAFVQNIVEKCQGICAQYASNDQFQDMKINEAIKTMEDGYLKFLHQVTHYVYTNWNQKFQMKGASEKKSFREYYASTPWKAEYFYVMIFLMRQQQWSQDAYKIYKDQTYAAWVQQGQTQVSEETLGDFESVLFTADVWISNIISNEPVESTSKRQKVQNPDRRSITALDMMQENNFMNFEKYISGIQKISQHFQNLYNAERSINESMQQLWQKELQVKPFTMKLYTRVKTTLELSNARFKKRYPVTNVKWVYWILRAINNFSNEEGTTQDWMKYLQDAGQISNNHKPTQATFPLGADFDTHNAVDSLAARLDRLNDW